MKRYGALETGGTKMVLAVLDEQGNFLERAKLPTKTPQETMAEMIAFFREHPVSALGIGSFGPLDLNPSSPTFGSITATPKLSWRNFPIVPEFTKALQIPVAMDTDVNAAALAESVLGAAKGLESCLYVTVGTGIGGSLIVNGKPVHGLLHPEIGHIRVSPLPGDPLPKGICPYHGCCLEGMAMGPFRPGTARVPSRLGAGKRLPFPALRHRDPLLLAGKDHPRRRRHAAEIPFPQNPPENPEGAGRLYRPSRGGRRAGELHCRTRPRNKQRHPRRLAFGQAGPLKSNRLFGSSEQPSLFQSSSPPPQCFFPKSPGSSLVFRAR